MQTRLYLLRASPKMQKEKGAYSIEKESLTWGKPVSQSP